MMCSKKAIWQEGEKWERFFQLYDEIVDQPMFDASQPVLTSFGSTQVNTKGNPQNPPVVLLHGISTSSIMFGDWLVPAIADAGYYCIAIDTIGDLGKSCPKDGDPDNGIHNEKECAEWLMEVFEALSIEKTVQLIGFSFGCYLASCFARHHPSKVDKLIMMAPACVVAPINKWWLFQAIMFGIGSQLFSKEGMIESHLRKWFFGTMLVDYDNLSKMNHKEFLHASEALGGPQVPLQPQELDADTLARMNEQTRTLLLIGKEESVIDPQVAVANAKAANIRTIAYDNASHMFYLEPVKDKVVEDALAFLSGQ